MNSPGFCNKSLSSKIREAGKKASTSAGFFKYQDNQYRDRRLSQSGQRLLHLPLRDALSSSLEQSGVFWVGASCSPSALLFSSHALMKQLCSLSQSKRRTLNLNLQCVDICISRQGPPQIHAIFAIQIMLNKSRLINRPHLVRQNSLHGLAYRSSLFPDHCAIDSNDIMVTLQAARTGGNTYNSKRSTSHHSFTIGSHLEHNRTNFTTGTKNNAHLRHGEYIE